MPMTLISRQTLTGTAASVTFNNIPQTYQTLKLVISARTDRAGQVADIISIRPNTSTANGSYRFLSGNGTAATSGSGSDLNRVGGVTTAANATASTFGNSEVTIPNYTGSANKAMSSDSVSENNATDSFQEMQAGLWSNTSGITAIVIASGTSNNFVSGSTFSLYGIS